MSKDEVRAYLARRIPVRLVEMQMEAKWALGVPVNRGFHPPPDWVRKLIRQNIGVTSAKTKMTQEEALIAIAKISGAGSAMAQGARLLFTDTESSHEVGDQAEKRFKNAIGKVMQPAIEQMEDAFAKLPPEIYKGNAERFAAYTEAQAEIAKEMAAEAKDEGIDDTATEDVQHFIWIFWLEANTATSVHGLFSWMTDMRFIHCSEKLLEKICGQIGFRASKRGRKKRIPKN